MKKLAAVLLAMASLAVAAQEMSAEQASIDRTLEQMQAMIHHAVATAAEGARLIVTADAHSDSGLDQLAISRGRVMLSEAKSLILEVASGDTMMHLHTLKLTEAQSATMIETHQLEQIATSYINAVERTLEPAGEAEIGSAAP